jgi:hypothetical protein
VPGRDGPPLPLANTRVFATQNPSAVGGGRNKLPRSIRNLFTTVRLQEPSSQEVQSIALDMFAGCLMRGLLSHEHVTCLLCFHQAAVAAVESRDIGAGMGGKGLLTLRDVKKVRDILEANMKDELHSLAGVGDSDAGFESSSLAHGISIGSSTDLRLQVLCKVLGMVYGGRFSRLEDQQAVQSLVSKHLGWEGAWEEGGSRAGPGITLDTSIPATLRIGAAYLDKGANIHV